MKKNIFTAVCIALIMFIGVASYFHYFRHQEYGTANNDTKIQSATIRELFVCNKTQKRISVLDPSANQNVRLLRTIESTSLDSPFGITIDRLNNEVLVVNDQSNSIVVFDRNAHGTVVPKRIIKGLRTELSEPTGIALDTRKKEIFITNNKNNSITVYDSLSNGDIAPKRIIQGPLTKLAGPTSIVYADIETELFVSNCLFDTEPTTCYITVYPSSGSGNLPPKRELDIVFDGYPVAPPGLALDDKSGHLFLTNLVAEGDLADGTSGQNYISSISTHGSSTAPPIIVQAAQAPNLGWGITIDENNKEIFTLLKHGEIRVYKLSDLTQAYMLADPIRVITLPQGALYIEPSGSIQATEMGLKGITGMALY